MGGPAALTLDNSHPLVCQRQRQVRHTRPTLRLWGGVGVQTDGQKAPVTALDKATRESRNGGEKIRNFLATISETGENTSANSNNSNITSVSQSGKSNKFCGGRRDNLAPEPWFSKEVYNSGRASRQCTRWGSADLKT